MKQPPCLLKGLITQSYALANNVMVPVAAELLCPTAPLQQQPLIESPYSVPAYTLMLVIAVYAQLLELQFAADIARSNTDIQQHTPHSSEPMWQADSDPWQFPIDRHHLLPALHDKLLHALCCSSKAVVWAAALARADSQPVKCPDVRALLAIYTQLGFRRARIMEQEEQAWHTSMMQQQITYIVEFRPLSLGQGQLQQPRVGWFPGEQALHLLLPSVLLPWAAEMPSSDRDYLTLCDTFGIAGVVGIHCWTSQQDLRGKCKFELLPAQSNAAEESSCRAACHWQAAPNRLLLAQSVEEALHCLQVIFKQLLCLAASGSDSDSSSSSSSSRETAREEACPAVTAYDAFHGFLHYLGALGQVALWHVEARLGVDVPQAGPSSSAETGDFTLEAEMNDVAAANAVAAAWSKHAKHMYNLIETIVGLQANQPRGTLVTMNAGLPMLCSRAMGDDDCWHNGGLLQAALTSGPGSLEQLRLFSLLRSMLKLGASLGPLQQGPATGCNLAAASILQGAVIRAQQLPQGGSAATHTVAHTAATGSASCTCANAGFEPASQQTEADSAAPAINAALGPLAGAVLPWLLLLGNCCLGWAQQLAHQSAGQYAGGLRTALLPVLQSDSILDLFNKPMQGIAVPPSFLDSCRSWLGISGIAAQLAAMGYNSELLPKPSFCWQQRLQSASAAITAAAVASTEGAVAAAEAVADLVQQLQALGLSLCTFAISNACNNPFCSNSTGPSERELVKGSLRTCAGCCTTTVCGTAAKPANSNIGSSTSQCARLWLLQVLKFLEELQSGSFLKT